MTQNSSFNFTKLYLHDSILIMQILTVKLKITTISIRYYVITNWIKFTLTLIDSKSHGNIFHIIHLNNP